MTKPPPNEPITDPQLQRVIDAVTESAKYREITRDLVVRIGADELKKRASVREAIKATKNRLHQVTGAYWATSPNYRAWLRDLQAADADDLPSVCQRIMTQHVSTRERLPILAEFYDAIFAALPPIQRVLDLACGLNPLAVSWMRLAEDAEYIASDIDGGMTTFLGEALPLLGVRATTYTHDLIKGAPDAEADVALLIKALPCLEQMDKQIGARLLSSIRAPYLVVTFPSQSIGGRRKGMDGFYAESFEALVSAQGWEIAQHFVFSTEQAYIVKK